MQIAKNIPADGADALAVSAALLDHTVDRVIATQDGIVAAAQAGSSAAFAELHSIYSGRLYQTILSITRNPHDAEEALQETFFKAYRAIKTFEGKSKIYSWLTRIAINSALMILRKRRIRSGFNDETDRRLGRTRYSWRRIQFHDDALNGRNGPVLGRWWRYVAIAT